MWPCLGWHGHCRAIGPVGTARYGFCLIVPCLGHHYGTLALSGTARRAAMPVPCRATRLQNYNRDQIRTYVLLVEKSAALATAWRPAGRERVQIVIAKPNAW